MTPETESIRNSQYPIWVTPAIAVLAILMAFFGQAFMMMGRAYAAQSRRIQDLEVRADAWSDWWVARGETAFAGLEGRISTQAKGKPQQKAPQEKSEQESSD